MLSYFFKRFRGGLFWQDFNLGLRLVELALVRSVLPPVPGVDRGCDGVDGGLGLGDRDPVSVVDRHAQELAFASGVADLQVPGVISGVGGDQGRDDQKRLES